MCTQKGLPISRGGEQELDNSEVGGDAQLEQDRKLSQPYTGETVGWKNKPYEAIPILTG